MKILVATDGSDYSKAAIEKCCQIIAKPDDTSVKIVSVTQIITAVATEPFPFSAHYNYKANKDLREQAENFVKKAEAAISQTFPDSALRVSTEVLNGSAGKAIVEAAQKWEADLIVVGSHGYGFWDRMLVGSVSQAVVHHAPCSVMIVRTL